MFYVPNVDRTPIRSICAGDRLDQGRFTSAIFANERMDFPFSEVKGHPCQCMNTAKSAQDPQNVATAVADLVDTPAGERRFRTVVDMMGMGEHIQSYNDQLEQITSGIFNGFGMGDMLKLKKSE